MAITYSIDAALGRLHMIVGAEFTTEEVISAMRGIIDNPALPDGFTAISDHTRVQRPVSSSQVVELVALMEQHGHRFAGVRWAIVSTRPASYGMMRVLAARAQLALGMSVAVFFDVPRAEEWLNGRAESPHAAEAARG